MSSRACRGTATIAIAATILIAAVLCPHPELVEGQTTSTMIEAPRPPDGTYVYAVTFRGTTIGNSTFTIDGASIRGTISVKESASFSVPKFSATSLMRYDGATLHETGYSADFALPNGTSQHTDVTFKPGLVSVAVTPGSGADIAADPAAPLELLGDNLVASSALFPAIVHATGIKSFTLAVLSGGKPLVATIGAAGDAARPPSVPATDASLGLDFNGLHEVFWYDPATFVMHDVQIPAQGAEFRLTSNAREAAAVATPAPLPTALPTPLPHFTSRDVTFTSADGTKLAGTLTVPERHAPYAALVFVHGSGPQDRDETIGPNPVFLELSNALSNAGYAVLRYDKRGIGKSGGRTTLGTRDELLDDVKAAYRFASVQPEVDPKHIYLLGHSEGGELVPTVAAAEPRVAGIVLMAPPALPLWRVIMQQALASSPPDQRQAVEAKELTDFQNAREGHDSMRAWIRSSMDVDPIVDIKRVHVPILILQGAADVQVFPADLPRLLTAARSTNHNVTVHVFSNDNHLFEPVTPGVKQTPYAALQQYLTVPARLDPRMLTALETWLAKHADK